MLAEGRALARESYHMGSRMAAGFAEIGITPPVGIDLAGYHRPGPSQGLLDRLCAVALVIESGPRESDTCRAVLVSVDNVGMLVEPIRQARQGIAHDLGIPEAQVMVLLTHTHSGPDADSTNPLSVTYRQTLLSRLREVARRAARNLRPATVARGVTDARIGVNRRERGPDGRARMGTNASGPVDDRIGVLEFVDARTGSPLGLLLSCTAHANVLKSDNTLISGDFPAWVRRHLGEVLGCPILMRIGAAGDVNPPTYLRKKVLEGESMPQN